MAAIVLHPSELGYAFSYARADGIIGWGKEPFLPAGAEDGDAADWFAGGEQRMVAAGRLTGTPELGLNFTDDMTGAILALVEPGIVLLAQRKTGDGVRTQTVHARGADLVGLTHQRDGLFELTRYANLTAAAVACAGFAGAAAAPAGPDAQMQMNYETTNEVKRLIGGGRTDEAVAVLTGLGAARTAADSAVLALASPTAAGALSVLYCQNNRIEDTDTFSVLTSARGETWILFSPSGASGPVVLERSSVASLTARVTIGAAARLSVAG